MSSRTASTGPPIRLFKTVTKRSQSWLLSYPSVRDEEAVKRHRSRNKLLARERIDRLLDSSSSFLELSQIMQLQFQEFAGHHSHIAEHMRGLLQNKALRTINFNIRED
ncbi:hypothetical protein L1987_88073 [Smallanthus sonchifolius]|nr:hypothetical protein L1987_88073 [Smallanthus sonchifolius]